MKLISFLFVSPGERRLRAGWRLLGQTILFFFLTGLLYIVVAQLFPVDVTGFNFTTELISLLGITISVFIARWLLDRRSIKSLGLTIDRQAMVDTLVGTGIGGLMMGLIFIIEWAAGWLKIEGFAWQTMSAEMVVGEMGYMLAFFIMVGWQEELSSRGYQLQNLADGLNLFWGVVLSSTGFALLHLMNPSVSIGGVLGLVVSGLFLAYGYTSTRQLWLPIGLHIGWNFFEGPIFGFQVSGWTDMPRLIVQTVSGNPIFTGGDFGPEAGLILLPGIFLGMILIYWYTRKREIVTPQS